MVMLKGPRKPEWCCKGCGRTANWACRVRCLCGNWASNAVCQRAVENHKSAAAGGNFGGNGRKRSDAKGDRQSAWTHELPKLAGASNVADAPVLDVASLIADAGFEKFIGAIENPQIKAELEALKIHSQVEHVEEKPKTTLAVPRKLHSLQQKVEKKRLLVQTSQKHIDHHASVREEATASTAALETEIVALRAEHSAALLLQSEVRSLLLMQLVQFSELSLRCSMALVSRRKMLWSKLWRNLPRSWLMPWHPSRSHPSPSRSHLCRCRPW